MHPSARLRRIRVKSRLIIPAIHFDDCGCRLCSHVRVYIVVFSFLLFTCLHIVLYI